MKCMNCDHENPDNAEKCQECGAPLTGLTAVLETQLDTKTTAGTMALNFTPGEKFGNRYQIVEEIGKGGMGKVFKARDLELNILVALKMIKPELSSDPSIVSRFKRELLLCREIVHENVIRIHDLGEIEGVKYISMNYIEGNSLKEIIQSTGKLTIEKTIDIGKQVCLALKAAHDKGIVHRDLKPQNIMIDKKGNAYVLDFGIARSVSSSGETEAGIVLGTPDFISPEQIQGKQAEPCSDIYSLGIIMYEMVTGTLPFKADSPTALLYKHLEEPPVPPSKHNPQIPKKLERIILKCLEKKKKNRYQSLDQVLDALEHGKTGEIRTMPEKEKERLASLAGQEPVEIDEHRSRALSYILRFLLLLLAVYVLVTGWGLINDSNYGVKLDKIRVEDDTYHKNLFPVQKDWLPVRGQKEDCNAWAKYARLFPVDAGQGPNTRNIVNSPYAVRFAGITRDFDYKGLEDLITVVDHYGLNFKLDELAAALECKKLNPFNALKKAMPLSLPMVDRYIDMIALKARIDFLEGRDQEGLDRIRQGLLLTLDLLSGSTSLAEDRRALDSFRKMCRELVPYLLSLENEIQKPAGTEPGEAGGKEAQTGDGAAEGEAAQPKTQDQPEEQEQPVKQPVESQPANQGTGAAPGEKVKEKEEEQPQDTAALEAETGETVDLEKPGNRVAEIRELIGLILEKLEPGALFYKEYLTLVRSYEDMFDSFEIKKGAYFAYGKFRFWEYGFSINRYFFKKGVQVYQGMFEGLKYIRNMKDKSLYIYDHFNKHAADNEILTQDIPRLAFQVNGARVFGKLVLILMDLGIHGPDSREFADLKGSDIFINEFSGKKFEMWQSPEGYILRLTKTFDLPLARINYATRHRDVLMSFKGLEIESDEQVRALFDLPEQK